MIEKNFWAIIGYALGVAGAIAILFSRVKNENMKDLKDRVSILEGEREDARSQHVENQKAISLLQGKLDAYKEIPLRSIDKSLQILSDSATQQNKTNQSILEALQGSLSGNGNVPADKKIVTHVTTERRIEEEVKDK